PTLLPPCPSTTLFRSHAEAVHAVGCDLILKDRIVQAQSLYRALSHDRVFRENIDAVLRRFRVHLTAGAQLFDGAHHACALHSAEDRKSTRLNSSHVSI